MKLAGADWAGLQQVYQINPMQAEALHPTAGLPDQAPYDMHKAVSHGSSSDSTLVKNY